MIDQTLTSQQMSQFHEDGYLVIPKLFDETEMGLLMKVAKQDQQRAGDSYGRKDAEGGVSKLWLSSSLGDDMYSAIARCRRVVGAVSDVLGGEVVHFHHKMMQKEPYVGGAWEWHQDYGYWYEREGFLFPDMASCLIAVDQATRDNGCLQVIRGSHKVGRIDHGQSGDQAGADLERVDELLKLQELVYVELEAGDAVVFHGNTLHRSDQNRSANPRWSLICCYATRNNPALKKTEHLHLDAIDVLDDDQIGFIGRKQLESIEASASGT